MGPALKGKVDMTDYPYKYMYQLLTIANPADKASPATWWKAVCVKKCPTAG